LRGASSLGPYRHPRHLLRRLPRPASEALGRLRRPHLHRPAVQLEPELRGLLGRVEGEAGLRGPPRRTPIARFPVSPILGRNSSRGASPSHATSSPSPVTPGRRWPACAYAREIAVAHGSRLRIPALRSYRRRYTGAARSAERSGDSTPPSRRSRLMRIRSSRSTARMTSPEDADSPPLSGGPPVAAGGQSS
jgi:hypothetical protein